MQDLKPPCVLEARDLDDAWFTALWACLEKNDDESFKYSQRYRIDRGWYQKQDRIIRNNDTVESFGDAYGFRRKDGQPLQRRNTGCLLYHYGWVQPEEVMAQRRVNADQIGFVTLNDNERPKKYDYGDLNRFPVYFGSHPAVMEEKINQHLLSQEDLEIIHRRFW